MQEFFRSIQKFLLKKEQKYGQLKYLLSRATVETSSNIDELVQDIANIFDDYEILPTDRHTKSDLSIEVKTDEKVFQSYRYLLLNTHFHAQSRLAEDILHGHLVDLWPSLSPYLFIQIIWKLRYEDLLLESILYTPLELCLEIMEIASKCVMELEFERASRFIINLIHHTYKRCFLLHNVGTQVDDLEERMQHLIANFQTLLDQLMNLKTTDEFSDLRMKHERYGIILKDIIRAMKMCMETRLTNGVSTATEKLYTLTFGNEHYYKFTDHSLNLILLHFDKDMMRMLEKLVKEVDCYTYLTWAEVDDQDNVTVTLQRAIAIEAYHLLQFVNHDLVLSNRDDLRQFLEQLLGTNFNESILTLQELCHGIENGRPENMKELIKRNREWDECVLDFVYRWRTLLDKDDCKTLLEYVCFKLSSRSTHNETKRKIQTTIIKIVANRNIEDIYDITITYILRHSDRNFLEPYYDESNFEDLIFNNINMRDPLNMRILLISLLHNPKRVLTTLIRIAIGSPMYSDVLFTPQDILFLRPFLCVRRIVDSTYLAYMLKNVCMQNDIWDTKKFTDFVRLMLDTKVTNSDDLMNNVFIPYLAEKSFDDRNINCMLINIYRILNYCTQNMDVVALCTVLIRKMSIWRRCSSMIHRATVNEVLTNMMRVLDNYLYPPYRLSILEKRAVIDAVVAYVEPLDKANLAPLSHMSHGNILEIVDDYERRCFPVRRQLMLERRCVQYVRDYVATLKLKREDFIRHMFLHATELEYQTHCLELTLMFWFIFGWINELDAFDNVLRITAEAMHIALEYPAKIPCDAFIILLKYIVSFCRLFAAVDRIRCHEEMILRILLKNLSYVGESIQYTQHLSKYSSFLQDLNCTVKNENLRDKFQVRIVSKIFQIVSIASV